MTGEHARQRLVGREAREERQGHRGMAFWLTGMSGAGKSTLARLAEAALFKKNYNVVVLDGDVMRAGLCRDLGFSLKDRSENNRRAAELAKILVDNGIVCLCAFISPSASSRENAKRIIGEHSFREVFIACSVEECERRDVKGLYEKARRGEIKNFTGVSQGYEPPLFPDSVIATENASEAASANMLVDFIESCACRTETARA
jgi:adenylyl-sulfate kinase